MGCNDFGSVMLEENVVSAAGSTWAMTIDDVEHNIRTAGFVPVRRNMRYDHLTMGPIAGPAAGAALGVIAGASAPSLAK